LTKVGSVFPKPGRSGGSLTTSIPLGYEIEGFLLSAPKIGFQIELLRVKKNRKYSLGVFTSSLVHAIDKGHFETEFSVYSLDVLS
jgi:hypothetical protein